MSSPKVSLAERASICTIFELRILANIRIKASYHAICLSCLRENWPLWLKKNYEEGRETLNNPNYKYLSSEEPLGSHYAGRFCLNICYCTSGMAVLRPSCMWVYQACVF